MEVPQPLPKFSIFVPCPLFFTITFPTLRLQMSSYLGFLFLKNLRGIPHKNIQATGRLCYLPLFPLRLAFKDVQSNTLSSLNETLTSLLSISYSLLIKGNWTQSTGSYLYRCPLLSPIKDIVTGYCQSPEPECPYTIIIPRVSNLSVSG